MILFWSLATGMIALALAFLLPPLLRSRRSAASDMRQATNAGIYREQVEELAADLARGAITQEEFLRANTELERRVIAENAASAAPAQAGARPFHSAAIAIALAVPLFAGLGYWQFGKPAALGAATAEDAEQAVSREQMEGLVEKLSARMEQAPDDPDGWTLLGRSLSVLGKYERSAQAFAKAAALVPGDAGLLADYADALAMAQGRRLAGEPLAIVERALRIDPENLKALALAGSGEFERKQYAAAIGYWERILKITPPETEFGRSVAESIAEARALSGGAPAQKKEPAPKAALAAKGRASEAVSGTVSLDPALKARVGPADTVFVLARPASGSRMPLAIARTTVSALPYTFTLDDSMAMAPGATISSHAQVVVAARVSKSGNAMPQKGDIEGASQPVAPGAKGLRVVISRVVD